MLLPALLLMSRPHPAACLFLCAAAAAVLYDFLSANRISLGNALDGIIAAKRVNM
jgi:hypothetical protein